MTPRIWVVSDGRAGNRTPALALAGRLGPVAGELTLLPRAPWRWLAPRRLPGVERAFGDAFATLLGSPPDVVVGCGRQAALATRRLREAGSRVVQLLDPRLDPAHWDLVVAPQHDRVRGANVITTLGSLHAVDAGWRHAMRRDWPALGVHAWPRHVLLLGGPTAAAPLGRGEWQRIAEGMEAMLAAEGGSLLVSSSRRTPRWLREAARQRFANVAGMQWHGDADGPNPYPGLLGWGDRFIVSADSVNLISEACGSGVPVYVDLPRLARGRLASFHRALVTGRHLQPLGETGAWTPVPLRELDLVAGTVRQRLGLPG